MQWPPLVKIRKGMETFELETYPLPNGCDGPLDSLLYLNYAWLTASKSNGPPDPGGKYLSMESGRKLSSSHLGPALFSGPGVGG